MSAFVDCSFERHAEAILEIFNVAIETSTALYDTDPRSMEFMAAWFEAKRARGLPVIGVESPADKELIGFATYGPFRPHAAYRYTVEHSLYVRSHYAGQGFGKRLLSECIARARNQGYHSMLGVIDSQNAVSRRLHETLGFQRAGTLREVGFKFGRWLDVDLYELRLKAPR